MSIPDQQQKKMSSNPLVSGIIIFLNAEKFIEEAIESVFAQTYNHWELLLVDDGSTDGSTAIAQHFAEKYPDKVRYLEHKGHQNLGMSAARNLGVRNAKGKYIAFLDADDVWLPLKLKQQVAILESKPEAAMLYGRTQFWYSWTGNPQDLKRDRMTELGVQPNTLVKPPTLLTLFLQKEDTVASTCSVLIRREVFEDIGGFEDDFRNMYEDMVFYTKVFLHTAVFVAGDCWDKYRQHKDNSCTVALRAGQLNLPSKPNPTRGKFLHWVEQYLIEQDAENTEVWKVLQQQLWSYRHPLLYQMSETPKYLSRQTKRVVKRIGQRILPSYIRRWLKVQKQRQEYIPLVGWVRFGSLRRLTPISKDFGFERGIPIDRYYIEKFLADQASDIRGHVLEMSENTYTQKFGGDRVIKSDVLHVYEGNPIATIVGDLTCADHIPSDTFNCIILTQTLPFIYDVRAALKTLYRLLKPGGVLLVTFAGISQISPEDMDLWGEYWRFTKLSARRLFEEFFLSQDLVVTTYGNVLAAMTFLHGLATEELRQQELDYYDPNYEVIIAVRAVKAEVNDENTWTQTLAASQATT